MPPGGQGGGDARVNPKACERGPQLPGRPPSCGKPITTTVSMRNRSRSHARWLDKKKLGIVRDSRAACGGRWRRVVTWVDELGAMLSASRGDLGVFLGLAALRHVENGPPGLEFGVLSVRAPCYALQLKVAAPSVPLGAVDAVTHRWWSLRSGRCGVRRSPRSQSAGCSARASVPAGRGPWRPATPQGGSESRR